MAITASGEITLQRMVSQFHGQGRALHQKLHRGVELRQILAPAFRPLDLALELRAAAEGPHRPGRETTQAWLQIASHFASFCRGEGFKQPVLGVGTSKGDPFRNLIYWERGTKGEPVIKRCSGHRKLKRLCRNFSSRPNLNVSQDIHRNDNVHCAVRRVASVLDHPIKPRRTPVLWNHRHRDRNIVSEASPPHANNLVG
jgi:hypothetical protein